MSWHGRVVVWYGMAWLGMVGMAWHGMDMAWHGRDMVWHG